MEKGGSRLRSRSSCHSSSDNTPELKEGKRSPNPGTISPPINNFQVILKRVLANPEGQRNRSQIVIPRYIVSGMLREIPNGNTGGHLAIAKTISCVPECLELVNWKDNI